MSEDSFAHERALISLLARLNLDFEGRISQFIAARQAGGGANRNRRRLAAGREALRGLEQALDIAVLHTEERLANILIPLREAVAARLVQITAPGFTWFRTDPLLPDFNIEDVAFAFEVGVGESTETLESRISQPLDASEPASGSAFDASEPATGAVPFNATESTVDIAASGEPIDVDAPSTPLRRSRSPPPVSGLAVALPNPKPPVPRPRVEGSRTPVPPAPRPKHLGVRTPVPPIPNSGRPASGYLVSVPKRRARSSEDLDRDFRYEFPTIDESFAERVSESSGSGSSVGTWTSQQWREYNRRQETSTASASSGLVSHPPAPPTLPPLRVLHTFNDTARFAQDLQQALQYRAGARFILSLDYHMVFDRSFDSTCEVLQRLNARPDILVLLCSKCSTQRLITNAIDAVGRACRTSHYTVRHFACLFIPGPDKSAKLWTSLRDVEALQNLPLAHVDDKSFICDEFNAWRLETWRGVHLPARGYRELADVVLPVIDGWR